MFCGLCIHCKYSLSSLWKCIVCNEYWRCIYRILNITTSFHLRKLYIKLTWKRLVTVHYGHHWNRSGCWFLKHSTFITQEKIDCRKFHYALKFWLKLTHWKQPNHKWKLQTWFYRVCSSEIMKTSLTPPSIGLRGIQFSTIKALESLIDPEGPEKI